MRDACVWGSAYVYMTTTWSIQSHHNTQNQTLTQQTVLSPRRHFRRQLHDVTRLRLRRSFPLPHRPHPARDRRQVHPEQRALREVVRRGEAPRLWGYRFMCGRLWSVLRWCVWVSAGGWRPHTDIHTRHVSTNHVPPHPSSNKQKTKHPTRTGLTRLLPLRHHAQQRDAPLRLPQPLTGAVARLQGGPPAVDDDEAAVGGYIRG